MQEFKSRIVEERNIVTDLNRSAVGDLLRSNDKASLLDALDKISINPPCKCNIYLTENSNIIAPSSSHD